MNDGHQSIDVAQRWVAVVPMRAGSKGLPGKNIRPLAGVPLYLHSVQTALDAGASRVFLSTDISSVLDKPQSASVVAVARPPHLAADSVEMAAVVSHLLETEVGRTITDATVVILLQPTSPLRAVEDVSAALGALLRGDSQLVMSVSQTSSGVLKYGRLREGRFEPLSSPEHCFANRQALPPVYRPNGAVYAFRAGWFRKNKGFATAHIGAVVMPAERSVDVDTIDDFQRVETLIAERSEGAA